MKKRMLYSGLAALLAGFLAGSAPGMAAERAQNWELVDPAGATKVEPMTLAPRIDTLQGKTVGLKWNQKPNGNLFLDRVAKLLQEQVPGVKIIKFYDVEPTTVPQSANMEVAAQKARIMAKYSPTW